MNYSVYVVYLVVGLCGFALPISLVRLAWLFIVSAILDQLRFHDISLTNVCLLLLVSRACATFGRDNNILGNRLAIALAGLVPIVGLATYVSTEPDRLQYSFSIVSLIASTVAVMMAIKTHRDLEVVINGVLWMSSLTAASVYCQLTVFNLFGFDFWGGLNQLGVVNWGSDVLHATGFFDANAIAAVHLLPGIALSAFLGAELPFRSRRRKLTYYSLFVSGALVATLSRAALIAVVIIGIVLLCRGAFRGQIWKIAAAIAVIAAVPSFLAYIAGFNKDSYYARYAIAWGAVDLIEAKPFLGGGLGTRVAGAPQAGLWGLEAQASGVAYDQSLRDTHCTPLQIGVEMGLFGMSYFGLISVVALTGLRRTMRTAQDPWLAAVAGSVFWTLVAMAVFLSFDSFLYSKPTWLLLGMSGGVMTLTPVVIGRVRPTGRLAGLANASPAARAQPPARPRYAPR